MNIEEALRDSGAPNLSNHALDQFEAYLALLLKWNSKINLTAVRTPGEIITRHLVECIHCAQALPVVPERATLLDFGSGAGLPGIPIAICRPDIHVTLAESQRKKAAFLREAVRSLALEAEVFDGRVEDMPPKRRFTVVTLRAVDKTAEASRIALKRATPDGWIVLFSTSTTDPSLKAAFSGVRWQEFPIPGSKTGRILLGQLSEA